MQDLFNGIFDPDGLTTIKLEVFLTCIGIALISGLILAGCYMIRTRHSYGFLATLALMPAIVSVVIMMVNGNLGAGVAVAGAFSLVRFRSAPGTAKEISSIFIAMCVGLVVGMGYLGYAILISVIFSLISLGYNLLGFKIKKHAPRNKILRITMPEDLDYTGVFDPIFKEYASEFELAQVKTTNMGSLFRLTYNVTLKAKTNEKEMIDKIRCRNGNLEITISNQETNIAEL